MQLQTQHAARPAGRRLSVSLAKTQGEIAEAQQLRHRIFAVEMGARLEAGAAGHDRDRFDDYCDHLLVRDGDTGEVVGTYRLLAPDRAREAGGLYAEGEFDLARLAGLRDGLVEAGRACVHPAHRGGAAVGLLWSGIADYMRAGGYRYLAGCASVSLADGGRTAAGIYRRLAATHAAPAEWRVFPKLPLPLEALDPAPDPPLPPLIKGYARAGASVCGAPAWDPDFNTADFFMLLPLERLDSRYAARFLAAPAAA